MKEAMLRRFANIIQEAINTDIQKDPFNRCPVSIFVIFNGYDLCMEFYDRNTNFKEVFFFDHVLVTTKRYKSFYDAFQMDCYHKLPAWIIANIPSESTVLLEFMKSFTQNHFSKIMNKAKDDFNAYFHQQRFQSPYDKKDLCLRLKSMNTF